MKKLTIGIATASAFLSLGTSASAINLSQLNSEQWDIYSGDNTRFDGIVWTKVASPKCYETVDERNLTPSEVAQVYNNLSNGIFGKRVRMTAGYAFDKSYNCGTTNKLYPNGRWHAGIDMEASQNTSVKTVVGGTTTLIPRIVEGDYFLGIKGDDGNLWIYGHLGTVANRRTYETGVRVEPGTVVGTIGSKGHLHLEVQPGHTYRKTSGAHPDRKFVQDNTISPLESFFRLNNRNPVTPPPSNNFSSPASSLSVSVPSVDLTVRAANIAGRTVYVQMFRPAVGRNPARTWNFQQVASGNTVVFRDMDGAGNTFQGVPYSTVVSLTPINGNEASLQRNACAVATGYARLCDRRSR